MDNIFIDFETYYDADYSLSKITTQQYLYDKRFEIIMVCWAINDGPVSTYTGDQAGTLRLLRSLNLENSRVVAHNAMFDGGILELCCDVHPDNYICTVALSRPYLGSELRSMSLASVSKHLKLGVKGGYVADAIGKRRKDFGPNEMQAYKEYCKIDVDLCRGVYNHFIDRLPDTEARLIDLTIKKFTRPKLLLDSVVIRERLANVLVEKDALLVDAGLDNRDMLMSNDKFADALTSLGVIPGTKTSPATGKQAFAFAKTDPFMKELEEHPDPRVQNLAAARLGHKSTIELTRLTRFNDLAALHKPLCIPLSYYAAHTGRLGGSDKLNMQNLGRGSELRKALVAPPGYVVLAGDLSQIEARIVAALSGQVDLVQAFASGNDVYAMFATELYGRRITKANVSERFVGKTGILQLGYGAGPVKFRSSVSLGGVVISPAEADHVVSTYRSKYANIPRLWHIFNKSIPILANPDPFAHPLKVGPLVVRSGGIDLPNGMSILYPNMNYDKHEAQWKYGCASRSIYGGSITENVCQALARIVIADAEVKLASYGLIAVLQVHDELVYVVREDYVDAVTKALELVLCTPVSWMPTLPLACEIKSGNNYGECK